MDLSDSAHVNVKSLPEFKNQIKAWAINKWDKSFKNGPSKICGKKYLKNFTWSILEYFLCPICPCRPCKKTFRIHLRYSMSNFVYFLH